MIELLLNLAILGFVIWIILQIPMPEIFRNIIIGVVSIAVIIWLLRTTGVIHSGPMWRFK